MIRAQNSAALARSAQLRRRRSLCLLATHLGCAAVGILAVIATVAYSQSGALSSWFTVGFVSLLALLGVVVAVASATPCPSCGRNPDTTRHFGRYSVPSRVCGHCGADLYACNGPRSE